MSQSKFIMSQKLHRIQTALMEEDIPSSQYDILMPLIFKKCCEENLTFWFNFLEDCVVLNLRDVQHENYELNIRYAYESVPGDEKSINYYKETVLMNAFLITKESTILNVASSEGTLLSADDDVIPKAIRIAIQKIEKKRIPVTVDAIKNHLPLGEMSVNNRMECNRYLKKMEASQ